MNRTQRNFISLNLALVILLSLSPLSFGLPIPENGVQREFHTNGKLRLETIFRNGLAVRKRAFYPNGKLLMEERYKNGVLLKKATYYENGVLKSLWTKKSGATKHYHNNGRLRMTVDTDSRDNHHDFPSSYLR